MGQGLEMDSSHCSQTPRPKTPIRADTRQRQKAALLSGHVLPSSTHPALSVPARNKASARALSVLSVHDLCPWGESLRLDRSHCSDAVCGNLQSGAHPALTVTVRNGASARVLPVLSVYDLFPWGKGCLLRNVMGTFIGMSESRKVITSGAETTGIRRSEKAEVPEKTGAEISAGYEA